ncbi:hypothetical protein QUC23_21150, partial [Escherichia coli]|nr:hypothetical protein [Escherichia coli]
HRALSEHKTLSVSWSHYHESDLAEKIIMHCELSLGVSGTKMKEIANQKYTWRRIAEMYEDCY